MEKRKKQHSGDGEDVLSPMIQFAPPMGKLTGERKGSACGVSSKFFVSYTSPISTPQNRQRVGSFTPKLYGSRGTHQRERAIYTNTTPAPKVPDTSAVQLHWNLAVRDSTGCSPFYGSANSTAGCPRGSGADNVCSHSPSHPFSMLWYSQAMR